MVELSRYIENGEVKRGVLTQDIKNRRLSHSELEELIKNPEISSSFFGKEVDEKKPEAEWDEAYLRRLSYASVSEVFNADYLLYLEKVAAKVSKVNSQSSRKLFGNIAVAVAVIAVVIAGVTIVIALLTKN